MAENAGTKWRQWVNLEEMGAGVAWEGFPTSNRSSFHKECLAGSQMEDRQQQEQQARIELQLATLPCRIWFPDACTFSWQSSPSKWKADRYTLRSCSVEDGYSSVQQPGAGLPRQISPLRSHCFVQLTDCTHLIVSISL